MAPRGPREIPVEEGSEEAAAQGDTAPSEDSEALAASEDAQDEQAAQAVEDDIAGLQDAIGSRDEEILRLQDRLLRLQADFDNYRRREMRARTSSSVRAKGDLIRKLLSVLDDMRRVAGLDPATTSAQAVIDGVRLVERKLLDQLREEGLVPVGKAGEPFDPNVHEAIGMWPAPRPDLDGRIAVVPVQGYRFNEQLLRPAQVQVYEHQPGERGAEDTSG
ncbi:MAG: nucleotide exchange factor GrpE [Gemmatimonadota bacterium]